MKSKHAKTHGSDLEVERRGGATALRNMVGIEIKRDVFGKCGDRNIG